jgi:hypothetical protein
MKKKIYLIAVAVTLLATAVTEAETFTYRSEGADKTLTVAENEFATLTENYIPASGGASVQALSNTVWTKVVLSGSNTL